MIILSDSQTDAINDALRPLTPLERKGLCADLFERLLNRRDHYGDGELKRELAQLLKVHWSPPTTEDDNFGWGARRPIARWPKL
jgi:hypothetical protein